MTMMMIIMMIQIMIMIWEWYRRERTELVGKTRICMRAPGKNYEQFMSRKKTLDSHILFMSKWPQKIVRTLYEQLKSKVRTSDSEAKERRRWEKICAEIKRNSEKKWIQKQWGKETVKSSSEQERMQYRRRPYSSWAVYEQIMSRLWAGGDTHKTGSGTSSRVDKRKSKTK